jgi:long-chain acyl-CoA synthetase
MRQGSWLGHYDAGVPATLDPYPDRTLLDYLAEAAAERPDRAALWFKGATVTHAQLASLSNAFAAALAALGVAAGDRVALLLPNCPQFLICELGAWKAGAVVVPLNPLYSEQEVQGALARTGAGTIVVLTPFYERVKAVQPRTALRNVVATNVKEYLPPLLRVLFTLAKERKDGHRVRPRPGDHRLPELLERHAGAKPGAGPRPDDPATILMSGGTTGTPKGVVGLHRHYAITASQISSWLRAGMEPGEDTVLAALPLFHSFANIGIQGVALFNHDTLALVPNPRDLKDLLHTIGQVRPTTFAGVPTLFNALLNHPDVRAGKVDFSSIKVCFSGAAPLLAETKRRFEELTGGRIVEGYSLTEAMLACAVNPLEGPNKLGSVGMPLPDVQMRIVDADDGVRELPAGEVGELLIRAPQLMASYWNDPGETAEALRSHDGATWLHTGDLGYLDEDGYLFIVDRKKELIKTSGYQVWPREIEEALAAHPAVAEVGVAGVADPSKGEVAKAWVVLRPGAQATVEELRAWCRERLAPFKVPAQVEFRDELPKTLVGKVLRRALVAEERQRSASPS